MRAGCTMCRLVSPYFLKLKRFLWTEGVKNHLEASKTIFPPGVLHLHCVCISQSLRLNTLLTLLFPRCSQGDLCMVELYTSAEREGRHSGPRPISQRRTSAW